MTTIDLQDYVAGGYFIARFATDGHWKSSIMPERVVSLSSCIARTLRPYWGENLNLENNIQNLLDFGMPESKLQAFHEWSLTAGDPLKISSLAEGRWLLNHIFPSDTNVMLLALGMRRELVSEFLTFKDYPPVHPGYITYPTPEDTEHARQSVENHVVKQCVDLEPGGSPLGYELIAYRHELSHSWLCSAVERVMQQLYGIQPNQYGLLDSYQDAKKVYNWIAEDDLQGHRAEPNPTTRGSLSSIKKIDNR